MSVGTDGVLNNAHIVRGRANSSAFGSDDIPPFRPNDSMEGVDGPEDGTTCYSNTAKTICEN